MTVIELLLNTDAGSAIFDPCILPHAGKNPDGVLRIIVTRQPSRFEKTLADFLVRDVSQKGNKNRLSAIRFENINHGLVYLRILNGRE